MNDSIILISISLMYRTSLFSEKEEEEEKKKKSWNRFLLFLYLAYICRGLRNNLNKNVLLLFMV